MAHFQNFQGFYANGLQRLLSLLLMCSAEDVVRGGRACPVLGLGVREGQGNLHQGLHPKFSGIPAGDVQQQRLQLEPLA